MTESHLIIYRPAKYIHLKSIVCVDVIRDATVQSLFVAKVRLHQTGHEFVLIRNLSWYKPVDH